MQALPIETAGSIRLPQLGAERVAPFRSIHEPEGPQRIRKMAAFPEISTGPKRPRPTSDGDSQTPSGVH